MEVILNNYQFRYIELSILHVCGGDPTTCYLLPQKEYGILHVSGGDPALAQGMRRTGKYSPRKWR